MKKLKLSVVIGVLAAIVIGSYFFINMDSVNPEELTKVAEEINERGIQVKAEDRADNVELNMNESEVQTYLHHMTHQHVFADKKWGSIESSSQNIENLLVIVQANENAYEYGYYYVEVLEQWQDGNFDNAVSVHNFVWNQKGGTVGKATRLLNDEEKKRYANENFK